MDYLQQQPSLDLCGTWEFAWSDGEMDSCPVSSDDIMKLGMPIYKCNVPGNFELDMYANGIIDDPFYGMNITSLRKYEKSHVWYFTRFKASEQLGYIAELVFEGVDCLADYYLNGTHIGSSDNMLVEHCFNVDGFMNMEEDNELLIHLRPPVEEAKKYDYSSQLYAFPANVESLYIRKAPHMYGWDIMPRAVSCGIWRPVKLRFRPKENLKEVFLQTLCISENRNCAKLSLFYNADISLTHEDVYEIDIFGECGMSEFSKTERMLFGCGKLQINVDNPMLWWPRGRGEASLYNVKVSLIKNGREIDSMVFTHGIRTVELDRTSVTDQCGNGRFCFMVNGEKVFVKGTNWVPMDAYHSRDFERIPAAIDLVEDIGCNMIRCWGGNVYENNLFYELCDSKGIMVWQDFAMACGIYPNDSEFCKRIENEAAKIIKRLRQHACIVLWAGDNECDIVHGWDGRSTNPNNNVLTREVLPRVVCREDGSRPYLPSSPFVDEEAYRVGAEYIPENHPWGFRDYFKSDYYKNVMCHFASEIGYHGCPSPESLKKFISPKKLWPYSDNDEWLLHSTSPIPEVDIFGNRVELMARHIREFFGEVPDNLDDFSFASQIAQAEALKFFIEFFRSGKWRRTGIIWWNIIDGWPQMADAVVDYYYNKKLAYDYVKRSQVPICLMMREPSNCKQELVAVNDTRDDARIDYKICDIDTMETLAQGRKRCPADSTYVLNEIPYSNNNSRFYIMEWSGDGFSGKNHYLAGMPTFNLLMYKSWLKMAGFTIDSSTEERLRQEVSIG